MNRTLIALSALALVACKGDKSASDSGSSDDAANSCGAIVSSSVPTDGAADAYYRADIEFAISEADASAVVTLTDASGAAVSGAQSLSDDGLTVYFTPDAALASGSAYTADISLCNGSTNPSIGFTTSGLGEPLEGCELAGNTYNVNLGEARFVQPAGVADLLLGQLTSDVLFGVTSAETELEMMAGISVEGASDQDFCTPTVPFPPADFSNEPFFSIGPEDTTFNVAGFSVEISNMEVTGTFASDCSYFGGGELAGELDARVLAPALADLVSDDPDEICGVVSSFGVLCETCASDGEPYCITVLADQLTADLQDGTMECVAEENCHEQCADVSKTCDTADYPVCE
jgi:hypothetical protein